MMKYQFGLTKKNHFYQTKNLFDRNLNCDTHFDRHSVMVFKIKTIKGKGKVEMIIVS